MGVETKTAAASATAIVTGLLTWVLVTFVPVFRTGLPPQLATFLPVAVGWALSTSAGYLAPHTPRPVPGPQPVINLTTSGTNPAAQVVEEIRKSARERPPGGMKGM